MPDRKFITGLVAGLSTSLMVGMSAIAFSQAANDPAPPQLFQSQGTPAQILDGTAASVIDDSTVAPGSAGTTGGSATAAGGSAAADSTDYGTAAPAAPTGAIAAPRRIVRDVGYTVPGVPYELERITTRGVLTETDHRHLYELLDTNRDGIVSAREDARHVLDADTVSRLGLEHEMARTDGSPQGGYEAPASMRTWGEGAY